MFFFRNNDAALQCVCERMNEQIHYFGESAENHSELSATQIIVATQISARKPQKISGKQQINPLVTAFTYVLVVLFVVSSCEVIRKPGSRHKTCITIRNILLFQKRCEGKIVTIWDFNIFVNSSVKLPNVIQHP